MSNLADIIWNHYDQVVPNPGPAQHRPPHIRGTHHDDMEGVTYTGGAPSQQLVPYVEPGEMPAPTLYPVDEQTSQSVLDGPFESVSYEDDRHVVFGDLCYCVEMLNDRHSNVEYVTDGLDQIANYIVHRLRTMGIAQGRHGDNVVPACFEARCYGIAQQIKEYSAELEYSPNLAFAVSYGIQGIAYLVASLTICECHLCDNYSKIAEAEVMNWDQHLRNSPFFMPSNLAQVWDKININYEVLRLRPYGCDCQCNQCSSRTRII